MKFFYELSRDEKEDFCRRHNLSLADPDIIELARNDITMLTRYGPEGFCLGNLDFYIEPLQELEQFHLVEKIIDFKKKYQL